MPSPPGSYTGSTFCLPFQWPLARFLWLGIPLTLTLSIRGQLRVLALAVIISSLVWDITYIIAGIIGGNAQVKPAFLILYSIGGLTVIYLVSLIVQRVSARLKPVRR